MSTVSAFYVCYMLFAKMYMVIYANTCKVKYKYDLKQFFLYDRIKQVNDYTQIDGKDYNFR